MTGRVVGLWLLAGCAPGAAKVGDDSAGTGTPTTGSTTGDPAGGTAAGTGAGTPGGAPTGTTSSAPDFRERGPWAVQTQSGTLAVSSGCDLPWDRYRAAGGPNVPIVVLTHGLQRTKAQMATLADHLASWGLDVVAPSSCAADVWNVDQERNGRDMVELAHALAPGPALYAGHSAGGLAAFVATAEDPDAVGLLGLDAVEVSGIAAGLAPAFAVPVAGLIGDPGICNLSNNMDGIYAAIPGARAQRVTDADHCDFEHPTNAVCTVACGTSPNDVFSDAEIGATVMGLSTAWLVLQAGLDPSGADWWTPGGAPYEALRAAGATAAL